MCIIYIYIHGGVRSIVKAEFKMANTKIKLLSREKQLYLQEVGSIINGTLLSQDTTLLSTITAAPGSTRVNTAAYVAY